MQVQVPIGNERHGRSGTDCGETTGPAVLFRFGKFTNRVVRNIINDLEPCT